MSPCVLCLAENVVFYTILYWNKRWQSKYTANTSVIRTLQCKMHQNLKKIMKDETKK